VAIDPTVPADPAPHRFPGWVTTPDDDDAEIPCGAARPDVPAPSEGARIVPGFGLRGIGGSQREVVDAHFDQDVERLFVAGRFDHFGNARASNVVIHDPAGGLDTLGGGLPERASSLARDPWSEQDVWAATAHPTSADHTLLHRWDGSRWHPPTRVHGFIRRLRPTRLGLVAVGEFLRIGDTYVEHAAILDGGRFRPLPGGGPSARVHDVLDYAGALCITGAFSYVGSTYSPVMACQDQGGWHPRAGLPDTDGLGRALAEGPDGAVYLGGRFELYGSSTGEGSSLARWTIEDGWTDVDGGLLDASGTRPGDVRDLVRTADGSMLVVGDFDRIWGRPESTGLEGIARIVDRRLQAVRNTRGDEVTLRPGWIRGLAAGSDAAGSGDASDDPVDAFAWGAFEHAGSSTPTALATWGHDRWSLPRAASGPHLGIPGAVHGLAAAGACPPVLVGDFPRTGGLASPHVATLRGEGDGYGDVPWAGGPIRRAAFGPDGSLVVAVAARGAFEAVWVRSALEGTWRPLGGGVRGTVWALAIGPEGTVYIGGRLVAASGDEVGNLVAWDGRGFRHLGGGPDGEVFDLAFDEDGHLLVAGDFSRVAGLRTGPVARLRRDLSWEPVDVDVGPGPVRAVARFRGNLYVGRGDPAGGAPLPGDLPLLEAYGPSGSWPVAEAALPAGEGEIHELVVHDRTLIVGGSFPGGLLWIDDSGEMHGPGDGGFDAPVDAVLPTALGLLVGGTFARAGDVPTHGLALLAP